MKIGFLGNANDYPFMLARAIRRAGHDVVFILNQKSVLNRPEHRYLDVDLQKEDWIIDATRPQELAEWKATETASRQRIKSHWAQLMSEAETQVAENERVANQRVEQNRKLKSWTRASGGSK